MARTLVRTVAVPQRAQGPGFQGQQTVSAGSAYYGASMTFVPNRTGNYKVYIDISLYSSAGNTEAAINNPSGPAPIYVNYPLCLVQTVAFSCARVEATVTLTAGLTYVFQTAVTSGAGGFILFESNDSSGIHMQIEELL